MVITVDISSWWLFYLGNSLGFFAHILIACIKVAWDVVQVSTSYGYEWSKEKYSLAGY